MKNTKDPRHSARRLAVAVLFSMPQQQEADPDSTYSIENTIETAEDVLGEKDKSYDQRLLFEILNGVQKETDKIDGTISYCAPEWPVDKISKIDLIILRISVFEILYNSNTPQKVAIDEAIELSKEFGNDTSSKFINGVLGAVVDLEKKEVHN